MEMLEQIEEGLDNETASKYIDLATDAVEQAVTYTAQTFVDALKAEGAFTVSYTHLTLPTTPYV